MQNSAIMIIALVFVLADFLCCSIGSSQNTDIHKFCNCLNMTNDIGVVKKCKCVSQELKEIPRNLPLPLQEL